MSPAVSRPASFPDRPACWLEIENRGDVRVLVRQYTRIDFLSSQRIFHPMERGILTQGTSWDRHFRVKIYTVDEDMKPTLLLRLRVNRLLKVTITSESYKVESIRPDAIDSQLIASQRMEEVWDHTNYYETLRVPPTATIREIRVAYLALAKKYHPDHNAHPQATLMFERITEAYHTLSDEEVRVKYDVHIRTASGVLSKSYWRQLFCHWNRHKASQVAVSTILMVAGTTLLLTSALAAPSGYALPFAIAGGAIGGGFFAAGIGGLSTALSRRSALEGNCDYRRWMKYSFWYGLAGCAAGATSAGIGHVLGPAVGGGMAAVAATGAVDGAVAGLCFNLGGNMANGKWLKLIKRMRADAIALELAIATLSGAAVGLAFASVLMTSQHAAHSIAKQAKVSAKSVLNLNGGDVRALHTPKNAQIAAVQPVQAYLTADVEKGEAVEEPVVPSQIDDLLLCEEDTVEAINDAINLYEEVAKATAPRYVQFISHARATRVRMHLKYTLASEGGVEVRRIVQEKEMYLLPEAATFVEISFEWAGLGFWKPLQQSCGKLHSFSYKEVATRRFFVAGFGNKIHIPQIRDEFEQVVAC